MARAPRDFMEGGEIHDLPGCNSPGLAITWLGERGFKRHSCLALAHNSGANHAGVCKKHTHTQSAKANRRVREQDVNNKSGDRESAASQQLYRTKVHLFS